MITDDEISYIRCLNLWEAVIDITLYDIVWKKTKSGIVRLSEAVGVVNSTPFEYLCELTESDYGLIKRAADSNYKEQQKFIHDIIYYLKGRDYGRTYAALLLRNYTWKSKKCAYREVGNPRAFKRWHYNSYTRKRQGDALRFLGQIVRDKSNPDQRGINKYFERILRRQNKLVCSFSATEPDNGGVDADFGPTEDTVNGYNGDTGGS